MLQYYENLEKMHGTKYSNVGAATVTTGMGTFTREGELGYFGLKTVQEETLETGMGLYYTKGGHFGRKA